jgi:hypothetical protein
MSFEDPQPGEPGYTIKQLRKAETDEEFVKAYLAHKKELEEKHDHKIRPHNALVSRVIQRFGQYGYGGEDDPRREDALWLIREFHRYVALLSFETGDGMLNAANTVKRRTLGEIEADITHVALSVLGCERSRTAFGAAYPAERSTETSRRLAMAVDLGCTEMDDHDPSPCPKCEGIRDQIGKVIDSALEEQQKLENQSRNAGVAFAFGADTSEEDLEKMASDGIKRGAKAELELRKRQTERDEAKGEAEGDDEDTFAGQDMSDFAPPSMEDFAEVPVGRPVDPAAEPKGITREELERDHEVMHDNGIICMTKRKSDGKAVTFRMGKATVYFEPME